MPDHLRKQLELGGVLIGLVAGLTGLFGAFVLLPSRMDAAEKNLQRLSERSTADRELLVRIEERLIKQGETLQELRRK